MQSLVPVPESEHAGRRTLLLIYIHGFMGDETSFQSLPAHVHNLVTVTLADTHVVHTKIYPKYKSRRAVEFARDDFSKWLTPHESLMTDVILLGHSMGGLLSSEVVLLPPHSPATGYAFRHRIIGTINFDTPFLGIHPRVVISGLGSLFRPSAESPSQHVVNPISNTPTQEPHLLDSSNDAVRPNRVNTLFSPNPLDPNYDPAFPNDVHVPVRKGWASAMHFVSKHSDGLVNATKSYVTSHLEFGGAMADYSGLKKRYARIRVLEEDDENARKAATSVICSPPRIRFLNYYTASTGRPKRPKSLSPSRPSSHSPDQRREDSRGCPIEIEMQSMHLAPSSAGGSPSRHSRSLSISPRISVEEHHDDAVIPKEPEMPSSAREESEEEIEMRHIDSIPIDEDAGSSLWDTELIRSLEESRQTTGSPMRPFDSREAIVSPVSTTGPTSLSGFSPSISSSSTLTLPPIPPIPDEPLTMDFSQYLDKDARKLAKKEHSRIVKAYNRAVKDRESAVKDRLKLEEKIQRNKRKEAEKQKKAEKLVAGQNKEKLGKERTERTDKADKESIEVTTEEIKNEFSWEKVWAADRAREAQQREFERLSREGMAEEIQKGANRKEEDNVGENEEDNLSLENSHDMASASSSPVYEHNNDAILNAMSPAERSKTSPEGKSNPGSQNPKPKRDKKFCMLPPKDSHGRSDPTWVRVFMEGVDEVGAHCGLFFVSETYERLVGDVGAKIEEWVREEMSERYLKDLEG